VIQAVNVTRNRRAAGMNMAAVLHAAAGRKRALAGLGAFGTPDLAAQVNYYLNAFMVGLPSRVEQGTAVTPDVVRASLMAAAHDSCAAVAPAPCDASSVNALIDSAVAQYTAAYQQAMANYQANVTAGLVTVPAGGYTPPPVGATGGGAPTAYSTPQIAPAPTYPSTIVPSQVPTGGGSASTVVLTPAQAKLRNLSRPSMPLQVGDMFALDVMGAPNGAVMITATKNGTPAGTTNFGNTDSTGARSITGTMSPAEVGSWLELIQVGPGGQPFTLQFNVSPLPAASSSGPTGGGSTTATDISATGETNNTPAPAVNVSGGFSLSSPVVLLGIAAAAFFFLGGRR
jgi:hypothetical protein